MDVMVAPERQRQGLGESLFRTWDRNVGASLGLGLSDSSYRLFQKLRWPDVGPIPCLVKPLTRRALRRPNWPRAAQPARVGADAADRQDRRALAAAAGRGAADSTVRRQLHRAVGRARPEIRPGGAPRRRVPQLEVRLGAARPLLASPSCAATIATSATRSTATSTSRAGASRCSSTSWPIRTTSRRLSTLLRWVDREARRSGLRQDPRVRVARRLPARCSAAPATSR